MRILEILGGLYISNMEVQTNIRALVFLCL